MSVSAGTYMRNLLWVQAAKEAQKSGDLEPLARLFDNPNVSLEMPVRHLLATLFRSRKLARKQ
jgi:hypothetical protein